MGIAAAHSLRQSPFEPLLGRGDIVELLREHRAGIGADHYLLAQISPGQGAFGSRIIACDWPHDWLLSVGMENLARLAAGALATPLGATPTPFSGACLAGVLPEAAIGALAECGHDRLASLAIVLERTRFMLVFTAGPSSPMNLAALARAHMVCAYALSQIDPALLAQDEDPLSDRERECLRWVAEGKTTDEVALIVGVSSNTANSYLANAIQKLSANNRAMAMATAIRNRLI